MARQSGWASDRESMIDGPTFVSRDSDDHLGRRVESWLLSRGHEVGLHLHALLGDVDRGEDDVRDALGGDAAQGALEPRAPPQGCPSRAHLPLNVLRLEDGLSELVAEEVGRAPRDRAQEGDVDPRKEALPQAVALPRLPDDGRQRHKRLRPYPAPRADGTL